MHSFQVVEWTGCSSTHTPAVWLRGKYWRATMGHMWVPVRPTSQVADGQSPGVGISLWHGWLTARRGLIEKSMSICASSSPGWLPACLKSPNEAWSRYPIPHSLCQSDFVVEVTPFGFFSSNILRIRCIWQESDPFRSVCLWWLYELCLWDGKHTLNQTVLICHTGNINQDIPQTGKSTTCSL